MHFSVTFRHMEASDAIKEYAREKVDKIKKYFPDPIMAHVVLTTERGYQHVADVNITLHNGLIIKGHEVTEDMYSSIDLVAAKIERQVRRYKEKIRGHKARADLSSIPVAYHILEGEAEEGETAKPTGPKVIKTESHEARALSVEEAVMQMNLLHLEFYVFRNVQTSQLSVVYKRPDGNIGLIDTPAAMANEARR
jgi:putative sigma-54 modulation protein